MATKSQSSALKPIKKSQEKKGTKFKSDKGIDEVKPEDFDALLIPGGFSPDQLRSDARFVSFVSYFLDKDQPLFAICHGPQLFIQIRTYQRAHNDCLHNRSSRCRLCWRNRQR